MTLISKLTRRLIATKKHDIQSIECAPNLTLWPRFLNRHDQSILLAAGLKQLDHAESVRARRRMKQYSAGAKLAEPPLLHELFLPDEYYDFHEGHFDGVIHHYREMHLSSWSEDEAAGLLPILQRLYRLCPTGKIQTHLLHLASYGEILPHVDNISASGSWIMGVSLGAERQLRMEGPNDSFEVPLPSGSVYLQRDSMRYRYKHSILKQQLLPGQDSRTGQRLSIMIRDLPAPLEAGDSI